LSLAVGESVSAEDRTAVEATMTAVKNKIYAAITKGVLHVHNKTIDASGKDKALTEPQVKKYLNQ
jgi:ribosomal protein S20